jgi:hypothetical protein
MDVRNLARVRLSVATSPPRAMAFALRLLDTARDNRTERRQSTSPFAENVSVFASFRGARKLVLLPTK